MTGRCAVVATCLGLAVACGGGARYVNGGEPPREACSSAPADCHPIGGGGDYMAGVESTLVGVAVVVGVAALLQWHTRR